MSSKILVVDDDHALQVLMSIILTRAGFECECVGGGEEALTRLDGENEDYAVLMVDLILPGMDGATLLNQLREHYPGLLSRTIVLTSANRAVMKTADTSGVHAVIRKPFDIQQLLRATAECAYRE